MKKVAAAIALLLLLLGMVCIGAGLAHGDIPGHNKQAGTMLIDEVRNTTVLGFLTGINNVHDPKDERRATYIRIHPKYSRALYDDFILFCGDSSRSLTDGSGKILEGYIAVTFRSSAARLIDQVPCHEFIGVDRIQKEN